MDYVEAVLPDSVSVRCSTSQLLSELVAVGAIASGNGVSIPFNSKDTLAVALTQLQRLQVPFADSPAGWPPAAIFAQMRDEGLVHGDITAVSWLSPGQPILRAA